MRKYLLFILPLLVSHLYQTELVFAQWQKPIILRAGNIHEIAYSPDGKILAAADGAGIWLYDAKNLEIIGLLLGHRGDVYSIAFSPDGKTLASGGMDDTVRLWDLNEKKQIGLLKAHKPYLLSVSFSPDGKLLAAGGTGNEALYVWDVKTQKKIIELAFPSPAPITFSPDGKIAIADRNRIIILSTEPPYNFVFFQGQHTDADRVYCLSFSPDGRILASGVEEGTIYLWNWSDQQQIGMLKGHHGAVYSIAFNPDGKKLASGGKDTTVRLWDIETQKELVMYKGHRSTNVGEVRSVAFDPDGKTIASGGSDSRIILWDVDTQKQIKAFQNGPIDPVRGSASAIAFSPDGKTFAFGGDDSIIRLWDLDTGKYYGLIKAQAGQINALAFSPEGKLLASGCSNGTIQIWDAEKQGQIVSINAHKLNAYESASGVLAIAFSPDGKLLASGGVNDSIFLWDTKTWERVGILEIEVQKWPIKIIGALEFSQDGQLLASADLIVDIPTAPSRVLRPEFSGIRIWDINTRQPVVLSQKPGYVSDVDCEDIIAFSPDGKLLASGINGVNIWNLETQQSVEVERYYYNYSVAFNPDGKILAYSGQYQTTIFLWDVGTQRQISQFAGRGTVAFSPDGKWFASMSVTGNSIHIWDAESLINSELAVEPKDKLITTMGQIKCSMLLQNYPNPFNPETWIPYQLSEDAEISIKIYNSSGKLIRTLKLGKKAVGAYIDKTKAACWDGKDEAGAEVASGVYFYNIQAGDFVDTRKMVIAK